MPLTTEIAEHAEKGSCENTSTAETAERVEINRLQCSSGPFDSSLTLSLPALRPRRTFWRESRCCTTSNYEAAIDAFRRAHAADPGFAMAYWGEAMSYTHPMRTRRSACGRRGSTRAWPRMQDTPST